MSQTLTVSTQAELLATLKLCTGGETILLNSGNYGDLSLIDKASFDLDFDAKVTIAAANADRPPVVTGLDLRGATNLAFDGISFDYSYADGQPIWTKPFSVSASEGITFTGCTFEGDTARGLTEADNGYPTGFGLNVTSTVGITVTDCEFSNFYRGMVINRSDSVTVTNNDVHTIRMDGMNFAAVQGVLIEGNTIHDFARSMDSADHSDMIQFWTAGTTRPSTDIVIRNNTLDIGEGQYTQSIFMRNDMVDRGLAGEELYYQNVLIEGNTIINGQAHGITVGETNGLTITQNSVLHSDGGNPDGADATVEIPRISVASSSTNVTISHNATSSIVGDTGQADWAVSMNAFVQDQNATAPGWYGDVFVTSTLHSATGLQVLDTGMMAQLNAGAPAQMVSAAAAALDAAFHASSETVGGKTVHFDASYSTGAQPDGTIFTWNFGDGTTANGLKVSHSYADGGIYDATLTVKLPNGSQSSEMAKIEVADSQIVSMNARGDLVTSAYGVDTVLNTTLHHDADGGIQLGAKGISASVARDHLTPLFGSDDVTISMQLDADAAGTSGEVMRLSGSFIAAVTPKGEMSIRAWSSEGDAVTLTSSGHKVNDGGSYDIDVRLEGGRLSLWINDTMIKDTGFNGTFADTGNHDLTFGNPWHSSFFTGDVTEFSIAVDDGPTQIDAFTAHAVDHAALVI